MRSTSLKLQEFSARSTSRPEPKPARSDLSTSLTLAAMSLGYGVVQLDVTIVNTALDSIGTSLGGGVSELQWVVSSYTIAFAAFILTAGALGDRIGAKRIFMAGFAIFTAASVGCALAPNAAILIAARGVQGLGAAILVPNSLALLSHAYPDEKQRGRAVGIWAAGASLALISGPLLGGGLIALVGWRSIFLVNLPIGLAGLWLSSRYAAEIARYQQREIDLPGQIAAIAALGCLAGAIIEGGTLGWGNPFVIAGFAASAVLAILFVVRELRAPQPMLPLSLFKHRLFALTSLVGLEPGTSYWEIGAQLMIIGAGLGLLVPPLTSTLLGSVEKSRSGIAAGVLNSTRQTGSVLGLALFGSLAGQANAFMAGMHESLMISACLLLAAGAAIWRGATTETSS